LLGINQGWCWSTTVIMKIDLVGPRRRGLAMGLNEAAGYLAVSAAALAAGYLATTYALRPQPFLLGLGFASLGLILSWLGVCESHDYTLLEAAQAQTGAPHAPSTPPPSFAEVIVQTSWKNRTLFAACQAGLVNNLNDGLSWGLFPLYFAVAGLSTAQIGLLVAVYPASWGVGQLATGALSDRWGRKWLIAGGMLVQAGGLFLMVLAQAFWPWLAGSILLGVGTALVYPTLLAAVSDVVHPSYRASAVGVYRLWRDAGYAFGALLAGGIADLLGIPWAIGVVGGLTALSGLLVAFTMRETLARRATLPLENSPIFREALSVGERADGSQRHIADGTDKTDDGDQRSLNSGQCPRDMQRDASKRTVK
jgi:MFS family permease